MDSEEQQKAAEFWDRSIRGPVDHAYYGAPGFGREFNARISGDPEVGYVGWFARWAAPRVFENALVVGCGASGDELELLAQGAVRHITAVDISAASLKLAGERAEAAGVADRLTYVCADATTEDLGQEEYDLVCAFACVHHMDRLEQFFDGVARALTADGLLFMVDFVGATRFQWPQQQVDACDALLAAMPSRLKRRTFYPSWYRLLRTAYAWLGADWWGRWVGARIGGPVDRWTAELHSNPVRQDRIIRPTLASFERHDPSEAIRSGEILPVLEARFDTLERRELGLSLAAPVLNGIAANYRVDDEEAIAVLQEVFAADRQALEAGELSSDYVAVVARPKPSARRRINGSALSADPSIVRRCP